MTLVLEIEFLSGVAFAAINASSPVADWPPQPDRVFSALVATWAAHGRSDEEGVALTWLESLPTPRIRERGAEPRTSALVYVPPNDPATGRKKTARGVLPALRSRQPRRFPATRPNDATIRFLWSDAMPEPATLASLMSLAHDTSYIGHSSSLTRCRFAIDPEPPDLPDTTAPRRRVYRGRFQELREAYTRFEKSANRKDRPQRGADVLEDRVLDRPRSNVFADDWLLLEHVDGRMPDLRTCALVAKAVRDALLAGYQRIQLGDRIPEVISGHAPNGAPSLSPHLAIIPLAFVGFRYADASVLGCALVPPTNAAILRDESFRKALRTLAPIDEDRGRRVLTITTKQGTPPNESFSIAFSPSFEAMRATLDPARYTARARTFATVTPIALDRHLKEKGDARQREIEAQVAIACRRIGLPEPERVVADKHSAIEGAPSAYPSGNSPRWTNWRLPASLAGRQLSHAVIKFSEAIDGPVILGAGRFLGLGLCLPLDAEN